MDTLYFSPHGVNSWRAHSCVWMVFLQRPRWGQEQWPPRWLTLSERRLLIQTPLAGVVQGSGAQDAAVLHKRKVLAGQRTWHRACLSVQPERWYSVGLLVISRNQAPGLEGTSTQNTIPSRRTALFLRVIVYLCVCIYLVQNVHKSFSHLSLIHSLNIY